MTDLHAHDRDRRPVRLGCARPVGALLLPAVLVGAPISGCTRGVLDPVGPVGMAERTIFLNASTIMLAIILPTILATLVFAWWFRKGNARAKRRPGFVYSGRIELVVWSIPLFTILLLGGITWVGAHALDPGRPLSAQVKPLPVQVVSLDWKWLFIQPEAGVASVNHLTVPTGRPLQFTLTSGSVMTVFFVPRFGSMIYVMNGMSSRLWLQVDEPASYRGIAAQIAGIGFPEMQFRVDALPPKAFAAWADAAKGRGPVLDAAAYRDLSRQFVVTDPLAFGAVEPGLYEAIVRQHLPPSPGPDAEAGQVRMPPRQGTGDAG